MSLATDLVREGLLDQTTAARFSRHGHFVYESGDHGDTWLNLDLLFTDPRRIQSAALRLAGRLRQYAPDVICGPFAGGALIAQWIANALDLDFACVERLPDDDGISYAISPDHQHLVPDRRVAIVDDAVNAGAATLACIREVRRHGGQVVAIGAPIVRQSIDRDSGWPSELAVEALAEVHWNTWPADLCPLCQSGVPIDPID